MAAKKDLIILVVGAGVGILMKNGPSGRAILKQFAMPDCGALKDPGACKRIAQDLSAELAEAIKFEFCDVVIFADPPLLDELREHISAVVRRRLLGFVGSVAIAPCER